MYLWHYLRNPCTVQIPPSPVSKRAKNRNTESNKKGAFISNLDSFAPLHIVWWPLLALGWSTTKVFGTSCWLDFLWFNLFSGVWAKKDRKQMRLHLHLLLLPLMVVWISSDIPCIILILEDLSAVNRSFHGDAWSLSQLYSYQSCVIPNRRRI